MPDSIIRTKLRLPFIRPGLVSRPRLQARIAEGLRGPLTLVTAPAGFGKTTLVASCIAGCGIPVAWLSLDKNDNQEGRFQHYLLAAFQEAVPSIGSEALQLLGASRQAPPETILTSLINDLDRAHTEMIWVLDDYQFISSQAVHEAVTFLIEHCPNFLHLVIVTRSDPPLPLSRLRARGQMVELRAADLRFTESEASQFLDEAMGLHLDAKSITALDERTEGWIAGLQMAALSMRDRKDGYGFIEGFSGTNRYILDYLLEEVLANQPPEIQRFLLYTSILERLTAPLCEALMSIDPGSKRESENHLPYSESLLPPSASVLEYLERANLFLVPMDDERKWYRYHHLFADLLRSQLQRSLGEQGTARLHLRASEWYEHNGSPLEAIHHASLVSDFERIESLIEQNYFELMNRGEMSSIRFWMGQLSKDLVHRRPWLCLYEAFSRSWFGKLEEAHLLLDEAEQHIRSLAPAPGVQSMLGYHAYVKSRVTAQQGDTQGAIELCLAARQNIPANNLGLQIEVGITLGYEYFLVGDFANARQILQETIRSYYTVKAINNPVAAYALLARLNIILGQLQDADDLFQKAAQLIHETGGQYLSATSLIEVGTADLLREWNDLEAALEHIKQGLNDLAWWGKADDIALACVTLARIQFAQGNWTEAASAAEKAVQITQTCGVFSEARQAAESIQVKKWLAQGDGLAVVRWMAALAKRFGSPDLFRFEDELTHITLARGLISQKKLDEAIQLLTQLERHALSGERQGRLIEILILKALALQAGGHDAGADLALATCMALAAPAGYVRIFLDEGQPMQMLIASWLAHASANPLRDYALHLLSKFDAELQKEPAAQKKSASPGDLVVPLSPRELEVLQLMSLGRTNQEIAGQLIVAPGTIKAHAASIFRKLDVANRTEAVAHARQLGILP